MEKGPSALTPGPGYDRPRNPGVEDLADRILSGIPASELEIDRGAQAVSDLVVALLDRKLAAYRVELIPGLAGINITGLYLPAPLVGDGFVYVILTFLLAVIGAVTISKWAKKRQQQTGQTFPAFWVGLGLIFVATLVMFLAMGSPLEWGLPEFKNSGPALRRGFQSGTGMVIVPELIAVWLALSLYTAAFIAEIVRAGILAVAKGQTEASYSLGLRPGITLRLIVIPQALRVIIPPLTSQFLNLTKNSSLAVAIAYPELVSIFAGTALNQVGKEIEMIAMMMSVYLTFSLVTAAFMNWFNARVKLVER